MKKSHIDFVAAYFSEIHAHRLRPFYTLDASDGLFFTSLDDVAENSSDVDKKFFREMAGDFLKKLSEQHRANGIADEAAQSGNQ